jgi:hypothetical protein
VACTRTKRNACRFIVGKLDDKGQLAEPRRRWNNTIEIEFQDIRQEVWIELI